jgi:hypothetical protein
MSRATRSVAVEHTQPHRRLSGSSSAEPHPSRLPRNHTVSRQGSTDPSGEDPSFLGRCSRPRARSCRWRKVKVRQGTIRRADVREECAQNVRVDCALGERNAVIALGDTAVCRQDSDQPPADARGLVERALVNGVAALPSNPGREPGAPCHMTDVGAPDALLSRDRRDPLSGGVAFGDACVSRSLIWSTPRDSLAPNHVADSLDTDAFLVGDGRDEVSAHVALDDALVAKQPSTLPGSP